LSEGEKGGSGRRKSRRSGDVTEGGDCECVGKKGGADWGEKGGVAVLGIAVWGEKEKRGEERRCLALSEGTSEKKR